MLGTTLSEDLLSLRKPLLDSRLSSWPLRTFIVLHRSQKIFMDFHGVSLFVVDLVSYSSKTVQDLGGR